MCGRTICQVPSRNVAVRCGPHTSVTNDPAGAFAGTNPADALIDLVYALKGGYRQNAGFVMNRRTQSTIRKLKDGDGNYLWQPPATAGRIVTESPSLTWVSRAPVKRTSSSLT